MVAPAPPLDFSAAEEVELTCAVQPSPMTRELPPASQVWGASGSSNNTQMGSCCASATAARSTKLSGRLRTPAKINASGLEASTFTRTGARDITVVATVGSTPSAAAWASRNVRAAASTVRPRPPSRRPSPRAGPRRRRRPAAPIRSSSNGPVRPQRRTVTARPIITKAPTIATPPASALLTVALILMIRYLAGRAYGHLNLGFRPAQLALQRLKERATAFASAWLAARIGGFQVANPDLAVRLSTENRVIDFAADRPG
jgi:hypothetical protein